MKKITISLLTLILGLMLVAPALADEATSATSTAVVKAYKAREVVVAGNLTAISNKDLTVNLTRIVPTQVKNFPGTYPIKDATVVVKVVEKTKLVRKYSGKADFSELAVGDILWVNGRLEADGTITAQLVKDDSIRLNFYANKGEITAIDATTSTFSFKRDDKTYKVFVTTNTKFYKAGKLLSGLVDFAVGDEVRVRGVVRQNTLEITADTVTIVTDKSDVEARKQKLMEQERTRLEKQLANLEKQVQKIKDQIANLK